MKRPNILLIYTDQQRWDALGASGNNEIHTPNLDKLAAGGAFFSQHFVQNPICMPSRASFMSGRYPSSLGITHMAVPVPEETMTLPKYLRNYGYRTANIGKLHFLPHANRDHRNVHPNYGFDHLEISDEPGCYEDAYRAWVRMKAPGQLPYLSLGLPPATEVWYELMNIQDHIEHPEREPKHAVAFPGRSDVTHSTFVTEQTIEFIRRDRPEPWLCVSGFYSPHAPWVAPQEFLDLYDPDQLTLPEYPPEFEAKRSGKYFSDYELRSVKHGYYAMISEVDYCVGKLMQELKDTGQDENTIVIFTSDHGEYLGDHLRYQKGYPGEDCISRVPLIIHHPKMNPQKIEGIVEAVDVLPTILECCAVPVPSILQGESLAPALRGEAFPGKKCAIMEYDQWRNIRTADFRYLCESDGKEGLYDIRTDPAQYHNLAGEPEYQDELSRMRKLMLQRMIEINQPIPRVWPY